MTNNPGIIELLNPEVQEGDKQKAIDVEYIPNGFETKDLAKRFAYTRVQAGRAMLEWALQEVVKAQMNGSQEPAFRVKCMLIDHDAALKNGALAEERGAG